MSTTHFVDFHVLGTPQVAGTAARALRSWYEGAVDPQGDTLGVVTAAPAGAPWPAVGTQARFGLATEDRTARVRGLLRRLEALVVHYPGIAMVAAVHWSTPADEVTAVLVHAAPSGKLAVATVALGDGPAVAQALDGLTLDEAMCRDDDTIDRLGELIAPLLLSQPAAQDLLRAVAAIASPEPSAGPRQGRRR